MSTRNIYLESEGGRCVGLTTSPLSCASYLEIWYPQPPGTLYRDCFYNNKILNFIFEHQ
jgi:hypothetical protein